MSRHARIEEVSDSDSDPSEMDPSEFDPGLMNSIIQPANIPSTAPQHSQQQQPVLQPHFPGRPPPDQNAERERTKHYQCLYPIYFDSSRSRAEGRRVGKEDAVANPLAQDIANACSQLPVSGQVVFEPAKTHPKDWANPGRVRVLIKEDGKPAGRGSIKNSMLAAINC
jgi:signal recognition particle subunit SRP19